LTFKTKRSSGNEQQSVARQKNKPDERQQRVEPKKSAGEPNQILAPPRGDEAGGQRRQQEGALALQEDMSELVDRLGVV